MQGREVVSLINGNIEAGYHSIIWNADSYSSGVYFLKMVAGEFCQYTGIDVGKIVIALSC